MSRLRGFRLGALACMLLSLIGLIAIVNGGYGLGAVYLLGALGLLGCAVMTATGLYELICWLRAPARQKDR